jgi:hypothetical protein
MQICRISGPNKEKEVDINDAFFGGENPIDFEMED